MANEKSVEMRLPSLDELFSSQEERDDAKLKRIYEIPLEEIDPFPDHPFKVQDDEDMMNLAESIRTNGILTPATVRKKEDGRYELLSGHRRLRACQIAGIPTLRCEIVDMSLDEATIFMGVLATGSFDDSFRLSDVEVKPKLDAMKRQGHRSDLTSSPVATKLGRSDTELGEMVGESKDQIRRYIRLTELIPEILDMVDDGVIALRPAVELSYIPRLKQGHIWECMEIEQCTPSHTQAKRMRRMAEEGKLTPESIEAIMLEEKPNQKERIVLHGERCSNLFPKNLPLSKREDYVIAAMQFYGRYLEQRDRNRDSENER